MNKEIIKEISESFGSPVYIFDTGGFIENYNELRSAIKSVYPKYEVSYSYKTNYTPRICALVKNLGGYAEVVSDMEYLLARRLGYENKEIIYNGPVKGMLLEEHLLGGGIANIDSYSEAERVSAITEANRDVEFSVGIRINIDVGGNFISRFGMEFESEELESAIALLENNPNVHVRGLQCHISRARNIEAWKKRTDTMLCAADKYVKGVPRYISLGSGMYGHMDKSLEKQFHGKIPTYGNYAEAAFGELAKQYSHLSPNEMPTVFTEPGTTLVAKYVYFLSTVKSIKTVRGRSIASLDGCCYNLGEICGLKKLPISIIGEGGKDFDAIDLMGYTCLEQDLMYGGYHGAIAVGNIVLFGNVGGYSIVSKPQFIQPNCGMVEFCENGELKQIMRSETFEDVFSKFIF